MEMKQGDFSTMAMEQHHHVTNPTGFTDYLIVFIALIIVIITTYLTVKYIFWPGESSENHIKRKVLKDDF